MTGIYKLSDGSVYEITKEDKPSDRSKGLQYIAKCLYSETKSNEPFFVSKENLHRNTLYGLWVLQE